jgi:aminopeptidase N
MIVGSNERRYAWMDEGINTYQNAFANDARYPGTSVWSDYVADWKSAVDGGVDLPLMTAADHISVEGYDAVGYRKPGAVLLALRDNVVGRETMDRAMREYVHRWAFKHPTPGDFFRTIENVSGQDLSWFWRSFFYSTDVLDIGIDNVVNSEQDGAEVAVVTLEKKTSIPFPVSMRLALANGTTQDVHLPVDIWSRGNVFKATVTVKSPVTGARLWPDGVVPDWNPANDVWGTPPAAADLTAKGRGATSGGLNAASVQ